MTVYDNIAYGLKVQKKDKKFIKQRVAELLELVGLPDVGVSTFVFISLHRATPSLLGIIMSLIIKSNQIRTPLPPFHMSKQRRISSHVYHIGIAFQSGSNSGSSVGKSLAATTSLNPICSNNSFPWQAAGAASGCTQHEHHRNHLAGTGYGCFSQTRCCQLPCSQRTVQI